MHLLMLSCSGRAGLALSLQDMQVLQGQISFTCNFHLTVCMHQTTRIRFNKTIACSHPFGWFCDGNARQKVSNDVLSIYDKIRHHGVLDEDTSIPTNYRQEKYLMTEALIMTSEIPSHFSFSSRSPVLLHYPRSLLLGFYPFLPPLKRRFFSKETTSFKRSKLLFKNKMRLFSSFTVLEETTLSLKKSRLFLGAQYSGPAENGPLLEHFLPSSARETESRAISQVRMRLIIAIIDINLFDPCKACPGSGTEDG